MRVSVGRGVLRKPSPCEGREETAGGVPLPWPHCPLRCEDGAPVTALRRRPGAPSSADPSRPQGAREPGAANPPSDGEF